MEMAAAKTQQAQKETDGCYQACNAPKRTVTVQCQRKWLHGNVSISGCTPGQSQGADGVGTGTMYTWLVTNRFNFDDNCHSDCISRVIAAAVAVA